jgi:hypothetical protein
MDQGATGGFVDTNCQWPNERAHAPASATRQSTRVDSTVLHLAPLASQSDDDWLAVIDEHGLINNHDGSIQFD